MKKFLSVVFIFCILVLSFNLVLAQKVDLNGTWQGATFAAGPEIDLMFTLVIEQKGSKITGKLKDDLGFINSPITEAKLVENNLTFKSIAQTPDGDYDMIFKMNVKNNVLDGSWTAGDGANGDWTAKKVVAKAVKLTGTWVGPADTPDGADDVTCKLKLEGTKVTGTLNDVFGYFTNSPIKEGKYENNKISFKSVVVTPDGNMNVIMKGTVKGNKITGYWELVESGETGNWKATKKEAKK
jgi:hypothetical protein